MAELVLPALLQKRIDKTFSEDKARILHSLATSSNSGCDNSPKGNVDVMCVPLMQLLNAHPDYVTTSSCSGRIALFHSAVAEGGATSTVKRGSELARGWLYVTHDVIADDDVTDIVDSLCAPMLTMDDVMASVASSVSSPDGSTSGVTQAPVGETPAFRVPNFGVVSLKCEPFVMHVQCRTLESAKILLNAAVSDAGFRNSGVVPPGARIMVAIRHAGLSLDVPLVVEGVNVVQSACAEGRAFALSLLSMCNDKLRENFRRIGVLERAVAKRIGQDAAAKGES